GYALSWLSALMQATGTIFSSGPARLWLEGQGRQWRRRRLFAASSGPACRDACGTGQGIGPAYRPELQVPRSGAVWWGQRSEADEDTLAIVAYLASLDP